MYYKINPVKLTSAFMVPVDIIEKHIKLISETPLKVLLWVYKNASFNKINTKQAAKDLNILENDVLDALGFLAELGYLLEEDKNINLSETNNNPVNNTAVARNKKPTREDVVNLAANDENVKFILSEAQNKFGRLLRQNEVSTLVWLYADEGMDIAVLLMAIDYAVNSGHGTIGYIEKLAVDWINNGVNSISLAEERITLLLAKKDAWRIVSSVFGFLKRNPSKKEDELSYKWVYTFGYDKNILKEAYDRTIDNLSEFNIKYTDKILENWHKLNLKTLDDIINYENTKNTQETTKNLKNKSYASYNKQKFKDKLNEDYT